MSRIRLYSFIIFFCFLFLIAGLCHTQIIMYEKYRVMSEENRLKIIPLMAPRGTIFDSTGKAMVKDVLSFNASIIYSSIKNKTSLIEAMSDVLDIPREDIEKSVNKGRGQPYTPLLVVPDVGVEKAIHLEEISMDHPGLLLEVASKRVYLEDESASNVLGYIGLINRGEFDRLKHYGYRFNDHIGRAGLEKQYDEYLRGIHGGKKIEADHRGREVMTLGFKEPVSGKDVHLTINADLQKFCDSLLKDKRGAIVAIDPNTGAVIAMASAPAYDPNVFVDKKKRGQVEDILKDKKYPMLNRAIKGAYPPGSVFKVVVAAAAMEEDVIHPGTTFGCSGSYILGGRTFHCWKEGGHGEQVLEEAIKNSCNVYFWRLGLAVGVDRIAEYAEKFGLGSKTGIDIPGEIKGLLPSREWKQDKLKEKWYKGETLNYSVGQGYLLCTPVQIARMMSVFANGGYLVTPYIVEKVGGITVGEPNRKKWTYPSIP